MRPARKPMRKPARSSARFALLDLELRRLIAQPWISCAALILLPGTLSLAGAALFAEAAPGLDIFRRVVAGWVNFGFFALAPLLGLVFRGDEKTSELEALQVAGYSAFSLYAGLVGSRLVVALGILLVPVPLVFVCYILGGVTVDGLVLACRHIAGCFLAAAGWHALLGLALRRTSLWLLATSFSVVTLVTLDAPWFPLAGAGPAVRLVEAAGPRPACPGLIPAAFGAFCLATGLLCLRLRLGRQGLAAPATPLRRRVPLVRPTPAGAITWREWAFTFQGAAGRFGRLAWPGLLLVSVQAMVSQASFARPAAGALAALHGSVFIATLGLVASAVWIVQRVFRAEMAEGNLDLLVLARGAWFPVLAEKIHAVLGVVRESLGALALTGLVWGLLLATFLAEKTDYFEGVGLFAGVCWIFVMPAFMELWLFRFLHLWHRLETRPRMNWANEVAGFAAGAFGKMVLLQIAFTLVSPTLILLPIVAIGAHLYMTAEAAYEMRGFAVDYCSRRGEAIEGVEWTRLREKYQRVLVVNDALLSKLPAKDREKRW